MNKRKTSIKELSKIQLPGIIISELLELQDILPEIKLNLIKCSFSVSLLAQLRTSLSLKIPPSEVFRMESVNTYIRKYIAKSDFVNYITAATAIRKTMASYADDTDVNRIITDHRDLVENSSGPCSSRGGAISAMQSPERLRKYRRGIMFQIIGKFQSIPIYYPLKISRDIDRIGLQDFISCLPFEVDEDLYNINDIIVELESLLFDKSFADLYQPERDILLESPLDIERTQVVLPSAPSIKEEDLKSLPAWKKAALSQSKNFNNKIR